MKTEVPFKTKTNIPLSVEDRCFSKQENLHALVEMKMTIKTSKYGKNHQEICKKDLVRFLLKQSKKNSSEDRPFF